MQTVVRNPLADPGLLGVTRGRRRRGAARDRLRPERPTLVPFFAFVGGLAPVAAARRALGRARARAAPLRIILCRRRAPGARASRVIALVTFFFADRAPAFVAFVVGSLERPRLAATSRVVARPDGARHRPRAARRSRALNAAAARRRDAPRASASRVRRARLGAVVPRGAPRGGRGQRRGARRLRRPGRAERASACSSGRDHRVLLPLCALGGAALVRARRHRGAHRGRAARAARSARCSRSSAAPYFLLPALEEAPVSAAAGLA